MEFPASAEATDKADISLVDCDVHLVPRSIDEIVEEMDEPWRSKFCARLHIGRPTYIPLWNPMRADSSSGVGPAGSDPDKVKQQLFVDTQTDHGIITPLFTSSLDPEMNAAYFQGVNRWLAKTWIGDYNTEGRFSAAAMIPVDHPIQAVRMIDEWAAHPHVRALIVSHAGDRPFGYAQYEPIWSAAARHKLPVMMHFSRTAHCEPLGRTATGSLEHYVDFHSLAFPLSYVTHLVSLVCSGVLDRHPDLRFVFVEGGFLWYRPTIDRLRRHWSATAPGLPARRDDPLDYVLDHFRWTSQPIEEAESSQEVATLLERADADRLLMFSSDYPHYDYDHPRRALPPQLTRQARQRIMSDNARELFGLPASRPVDRFDALPVPA